MTQLIIIVLLFLVSWPCCHMSSESNVTRVIIQEDELEINKTNQINLEKSQEEGLKPMLSSSGLFLLFFLLIVFILLTIVLILVNAFICDLLKPVACFKDDSICLFVNRELNLVDEEEDSDENEEVPNVVIAKVKQSNSIKSVETNNSAENRKLINFYGVEDTEEIIRSQSPHHITPEAETPIQTQQKIDEKSSLSSSPRRDPLESLELGSFKTRTLANNNKANSNNSASVTSFTNDAISTETIGTDDLKPVFYELDELEKRLSESLCELVKMRSKNEMERLNECLMENISIDDLASSLIGTSSSNQDIDEKNSDKN